MAGPNYAAAPVRWARVALFLLRVACRSAALINRRIQDSAYGDDVKTASQQWLDDTQTFCSVVEVAYEALPD